MSSNNNNQSFLASVEDTIQTLRDCSAWSNDSLKELFSKSKKRLGIVNQVEKSLRLHQEGKETFETLFAVVQEAHEGLENLLQDLEDKQDNTPENLQGSMVFENRQECIDALEDCTFDLQRAIEPFKGSDFFKSKKEVVKENLTLGEQAQEKIKKVEKLYDLGFLSEEDFKKEKLVIATWLSDELVKAGLKE